jgi:hypothetical protein
MKKIASLKQGLLFLSLKGDPSGFGSTVRKRGKLERGKAPLFEKTKNSNAGKRHCSKKRKSRTREGSSVRKSEKFKRGKAPLFEKVKNSNAGKRQCSKKGKIRTRESSTVRKTGKFERGKAPPFEKVENSNVGLHRRSKKHKTNTKSQSFYTQRHLFKVLMVISSEVEYTLSKLYL